MCSVHAAREVSVRELLDGQQQGSLPESVRITYQSLRSVLNNCLVLGQCLL